MSERTLERAAANAPITGDVDATIVAPLGQQVMADSVAVVIASDQTPIDVDATIVGPLGQQVMADSVAVVIAGDQSPVEVTGSLDLGSPIGNALPVISADMRSAFGEPIMVQVVPVIDITFPYGLSPLDVGQLKSSGATIATNGDGVAPSSNNGCDMVVSIDNAANAFAVAKSLKNIHYRAGLGMVGRFTAAFNAGVASSRQYAGLWAPDSEYTVGYNGLTWGCFAKYAGMQEVRTLTVSGGATAANNLTITLDGQAFTVPVTNVGALNTTQTAWEIASFNYAVPSGASWGWNAYALGAVVYFVARRARATSGAFTFGAGATGAAAAFAQIRVGTDETFFFGSPAVPGANFEFLDALNGTGPSGLNLNKQRAIISEIQAGHLGHRGADFFVMNPETRIPVWFARCIYMNTSTASLLQNPTMGIAWGVEANGSGTAMTMYAGSGFGGMTGQLNPHDGKWMPASAGKAAVVGQWIHYVSMRCGPVAGFGGQVVRPARTDLHVHQITITVSGGGAGTYVDVDIIRNGTYTNAANFAWANATRYAAWRWQDTSTATQVLSGGTQEDAYRVDNNTTDTRGLEIALEAGETVGVNVRASAVNLVVSVALRNGEIQ